MTKIFVVMHADHFDDPTTDANRHVGVVTTDPAFAFAEATVFAHPDLSHYSGAIIQVWENNQCVQNFYPDGPDADVFRETYLAGSSPRESKAEMPLPRNDLHVWYTSAGVVLCFKHAVRHASNGEHINTLITEQDLACQDCTHPQKCSRCGGIGSVELLGGARIVCLPCHGSGMED